MDNQEEADIPKLRICMLLPFLLYGRNVTVLPGMGIFSHLANFEQEVTWVVGIRPEAQDRVQALFSNKVHVYIITQTRYFPGSSVLSRMLNTMPNTLKRMRAVLKIFKEEKCNVIFVRSSTFDGLIAAYVKRKYRVPFVFQLPNPPEQQGQRFAIVAKKPRLLYSSIARFNRFMLARLLRRADLILPQSKWLKEHLTEQGIDEAKMMPLHNGVDVEAFSPRDQEEMTERHHLANSKVVIYVGIMGEARNLNVLIQAFSQVKRQVSHVKLLMVGDGPDRENLENLADELGMRDDILFTGQVPHGEVPDLIAAADIGVSPVPPFSFYKMSSPLKLLEYMAMAKPVVANEEIPEHKEVLEQSGGGILVTFTPEAFAGAMIELLDNPERAAEMGRKGRDWVVKNRSHEILARQFEESCLKLLASRQG
jgi:glycosyltransferase involved in cell wall biosynthesis